MPKQNLTDVFVKSAKPDNGKLTEYADTKERGLCLRVTPAGVKSWTYRYRLKSGQQRRLSLGKVENVSLADARTLVVNHRANVASGGDPVNDAKQSRQQAVEQSNRETVKDVGEWYFRECRKGRHRPNIRNPKRASTITNEYAYFERLIVPTFGTQ